MALELIKLASKKYLLLLRGFFAHKPPKSTATTPLSPSRGRHGRCRRGGGSSAPPLPRPMVGEGGAVEPTRQTTSLAAFSTAPRAQTRTPKLPRPQQMRGPGSVPGAATNGGADG